MTGYRLGENFEIEVNATVADPEFQDSSLITFNSIEQRMQGEETEVMVTFARDLLNKNEECQELEELLNEAQTAADNNNYDEAREMLNTVISGCQYLVSNTQIQREEPTRFELDFLQEFNWFYVGAITLLVIFITTIIVIEMKIRSESGES